MEHNDAVRLQAVEKYILGELPPAIRDDFEDHYFDCAVCSFNLRAGVAFAAGTRQFFTEAPTRAGASGPKPNWFAWLKPMIAVPAFAVLLLLVGYQNLVSIPQLKQGHGAEVEATPWFPLMDANVKGSAGSRIEVERGKAFSLFYDITTPPRQSDSIYLVQMKDSSGKILATQLVSQQMAKKAVIFNVSAGLSEGDYKLVILDQSAGTTSPAAELPFTVAFPPQILQH
jgi:hypothetical protein